MIEQYLFARSSANRIASNGMRIRAGYGCVACTAGIGEDDVKRLDQYASEYPMMQLDSLGVPVPLLMKFTLGKNGGFAIGQTVYLQEEKPSHMTHYYVFTEDTAEALAESPDEMFRLPFLNESVDGRDIELQQTENLVLAPDAGIEYDLKRTLSWFSLTAESFKSIVKAVFDCRVKSRKLIFVIDGMFADKYRECVSLLYHIYRYLPYHVRAAVGFDSCFSSLTGRNGISISFAQPQQAERNERGITRIGERNCTQDYVVENGVIYHMSDEDEAKTEDGYLLKGLFSYIDKEASGKDCSKQLEAVFGTLAELADGIPFGFLDDIVTYDALFAAMELHAGRVPTQSNVKSTLRFYLASNERLGESAHRFWDGAMLDYLRLYEDEPTDPWILGILSSLISGNCRLSGVAVEFLCRRLSSDIAKDGNGITKYCEIAVSLDRDGSKELAKKMFTSSPDAERAYIAYRFADCTTAGMLCSRAADLYHELGEGSEAVNTGSEISEKASLMLESIAPTVDDIDIMRQLSLSEPNEDVRAAIHIIAGDSLDKLDIEKCDPDWIRKQKWSFDYMPFTVGGVTLFLLRDMLLDTSVTDPTQYFNKYTYVPHEEMSEAALRAAKAAYEMMLDGRLPLVKNVYPLLSSLTCGEDGYITSAIAKVLDVYPAEIPGFIRFFGKLLKDKENTDANAFDAFLKGIEKTVIAHINELDARDITVAVNVVCKNGLSSGYSRRFNAHIYDSWLYTLTGFTKALRRASRKFSLSSTRSVKANASIIFAALMVIVIGAGLALCLTLFGQGGGEERSIKVICGENTVSTALLIKDMTDSERINVVGDKYTINFDVNSFGVYITGGGVRSVYCEMQNQTGNDRLTEGSMLSETGAGLYPFKITGRDDDVEKTYIFITVRFTDGSASYTGFAVKY